jgi:hypothetical protein
MKPATNVSKFEVCVFCECPHCGKDISLKQISSAPSGVSEQPAPTPNPVDSAQSTNHDAGGSDPPPASESVDELKMKILEVVERDESGKQGDVGMRSVRKYSGHPPLEEL